MYISPPKLKDYDPTKDSPELSVVMPATRPDKWTDVYNSIISSTSRSFELIIVTNEGGSTPPWLWDISNIKIIKDYGSPVRAQCIGASLAEGKLITFTSDDGLFVPYGLDIAIDRLYDMKKNKKNVLVYKYSEGGKPYDDEYFKINYHRGPNGEGIASDYLPEDYFLLNTPLMYREFYEEIGGFSCSYECTAMACLDFAIRAQELGANVELLKGIPILVCEQDEALEGTHTFVHHAQLEHDEPLYESIYKAAGWREKVQLKLDHTTEWKKSPPMWERKYSQWISEAIEAASAHAVYGAIRLSSIKQFMKQREEKMIAKLQALAHKAVTSHASALPREAIIANDTIRAATKEGPDPNVKRDFLNLKIPLDIDFGMKKNE